jgi:hypothetical protein
MAGAPTHGHLKLVASQERTNFSRLRNDYQRSHTLCLDMLKQTDDPHDRMLLRGMARIWLMLAERS